MYEAAVPLGQREEEERDRLPERFPALGQPGLTYSLPGMWDTFTVASDITNSGAHALVWALEIDRIERLTNKGAFVPSISQLDQLVACWAAAAFLDTNSVRGKRGKPLFKSPEEVFTAFAEQREPWQASHLALACLACNIFPVILAPDGRVDCHFSLPPVSDILSQGIPSDAPIIMFYWTHRKLVNASAGEAGRSYKHFQPLLPPAGGVTYLGLLPLAVQEQLRACTARMQRHRFAFSCTQAFKDSETKDASCAGTEQAEQAGYVATVELKATKTWSRLFIQLPKDGLGKGLERSAYLSLIYSIVMDQVEDKEIQEVLITDDKGNIPTHYPDDMNSLLAFGFRGQGRSFMRSVRGSKKPPELKLGWEQAHELALPQAV
jgi:hypothetical protein